MPKENLKEKLEGNELDLSLNNITTVPVKDLVKTFLLYVCMSGWGVLFLLSVYKINPVSVDVEVLESSISILNMSRPYNYCFDIPNV